MKKIKRSLSLFLSLIMVFSVFSTVGATSFAAYAYGQICTSGPYTYELGYSYACIEKVQPVDGNINIVSTIDGYPITIYRENAFDECIATAESITFTDLDAFNLIVGVYPFEYLEFEKLNTAYMNFSWMQEFITDVDESQYDSFDFGTLFDSEEELNSFIYEIKEEFSGFEFGTLKDCTVVFQENDFLVRKPDGKIYTNGDHKFWQDVYAKFEITEDFQINPFPRVVSGPYTYVDYYGYAVIMDIEPVDGVVIFPEKIDGKNVLISVYTEFDKCADAKKLVYSSFESAELIAEIIVNSCEANFNMHRVTTVELLYKLEDEFYATIEESIEEIVDSYNSIDEFISDANHYFRFFIDMCDLTSVHNVILQDGDILKSNEDGSISTNSEHHFWDALYEKFGITDDIVVYEPPMKGHLNERTYIYNRAATCKADGSRTTVYECGERFTEVIGKLEHSYTGYIKNNGDGTHSRRCVNGCDQYGDTMDCTYGDWEETVPATCTTDGERSRTCTVCGYTDTQVIPHEHKYVGREVAPTCTEDGHTVYTCSVCQDTYTDFVVEKTGHIDENGDNVCDNCNENLSTDSGDSSGKSGLDKLIELLKRIINWIKSLFTKK